MTSAPTPTPTPTTAPTSAPTPPPATDASTTHASTATGSALASLPNSADVEATADDTLSAAASAAAALGLDLPSLRRRSQPPLPRALVLVHPEGAFAAVAARPRPLLALIVVCLWALLPPISFLAAAERSGGLESVIVDEMKKSGAWEKIKTLPAEARADILKKTTPLMAVGVPLGAASKRSGWILFVAVAAFFAVRGTSQRKGLGLGDVVGVVAIGAAPLMVHDLLAAITYVVFDLRAIDPQNPVASNLAALLMTGTESRSAPAMLLRGLDVFELWSCWLMAFGVTRVAQTRSSAPAFITFGAHLLLTLVAAISAYGTSSS